MTAILFGNIDPEYPTIDIRRAHHVRGGAIRLVLTPGRPCIALDTHHLEPEDARALGMALGDILSSDDADGIISAWRDAIGGGMVGAALRDGNVLLSIHGGGEHREIWFGPRSDGLDIALALLNAGDGALHVLHYATRPLFVVSPFAPGISGPH